MKELIAVEKEVYEAVLRNSVRVNDLEAENAQLIKFLEEFNVLDVAEENKKLKELLKEVRDAWVIYKPYDRNQLCKRIDNAIGEKK